MEPPEKTDYPETDYLEIIVCFVLVLLVYKWSI